MVIFGNVLLCVKCLYLTNKNSNRTKSLKRIISDLLSKMKGKEEVVEGAGLDVVQVVVIYRNLNKLGQCPDFGT